MTPTVRRGRHAADDDRADDGGWTDDGTTESAHLPRSEVPHVREGRHVARAANTTEISKSAIEAMLQAHAPTDIIPRIGIGVGLGKPPPDRAVPAGQLPHADEAAATGVEAGTGAVAGREHVAIRGLGGRAARGAVITLAGQGSRVAIQLVALAVLARILTPKDYGLFALIIVVVGIGEIFRDFGLSTAAIQASELSDSQRDNLFWWNAALGLLLSGVVFAAADGIAALFGQPLLAPIARVLSITFLINGLAAQYRAGLNRELRFLALSVADVVAQVIATAIGIACAVSGLGYWTLVVQQITQVSVVLVAMVLMARWIPGRPRRGIDLSAFLRFGWNLMATEILSYATNNLDTLTIGFRFGPVQLGQYNRAFQLVMSPLSQVRSPATTVALPILTRLKDDPVRAAQYIRRSQVALGYTIVAALAIGAGAAGPLIEVFLGSRWTSVSPIFALLCIAGSCQILAFVGYWVYLARGMAADLFRYSLISFVVQLVCIVGGSTFGVVGVATGFTVSAMIEWPLSLWWLSSRTDYPGRDLMHGAGRILSACVPAGLAAFGIARLTLGVPPVLSLIACLVTGGGIYAAVVSSISSLRSDAATVVMFVRRMVRP